MNSDARYYRFAFKIFADFSGSIAIPAVLAAFLGKWMDARYHTHPWFLIGLLLLAFLSTAFIFVRKSKRYAKDFDLLMKK